MPTFLYATDSRSGCSVNSSPISRQGSDRRSLPAGEKSYILPPAITRLYCSARKCACRLIITSLIFIQYYIQNPNFKTGPGFRSGRQSVRTKIWLRGAIYLENSSGNGQPNTHRLIVNLARPQSPDIPAILASTVKILMGSPIMGTVCHEVIRPHMVPMRRPEPDTRSTIKPQTAPLRLFLRNLETLLPQILSTRLWLTRKPSCF